MWWALCGAGYICMYSFTNLHIHIKILIDVDTNLQILGYAMGLVWVKGRDATSERNKNRKTQKTWEPKEREAHQTRLPLLPLPRQRLRRSVLQLLRLWISRHRWDPVIRWKKNNARAQPRAQGSGRIGLLTPLKAHTLRHTHTQTHIETHLQGYRHIHTHWDALGRLQTWTHIETPLGPHTHRIA